MANAFHFCREVTGGPSPLSTISFGMLWIGMVLAIWMVARTDLWISWEGWARAGIYLAAFAYGQALFHPVQELWVAPEKTFQFPRLRIEDFSLSLLWLLMLLPAVCVLTPMMIFSKASLSTSNQHPEPSGQFSILGLIGFTTTTAIGIGLIQLFTMEDAPNSVFRGLSMTEAIYEWLGKDFPYLLPPTLAAMVIMFGLSKPWRWAAVVLIVAVVVDGLGTLLIDNLFLQITGQREGGVVSQSVSDCWFYVTGRTLIVWLALSMAKILDVCPTFGGRVSTVETTYASSDTMKDEAQ